MPQGNPEGYNTPRFNRKGKRVKKRPQVKLKDRGMELNDPPGKEKGEAIKIVPGFKALIRKRKELIN